MNDRQSKIYSEILDRYTESLDASEQKNRQYVADFLNKRSHNPDRAPFSGDDDVDLRNYFMDLRLHRISRREQYERTQTLRSFYTWLKKEDLISSNPFVSFDFERPYLTRANIRRCREIFAKKEEVRQIERLEMLYKLAEGLNRGPDMNSALQVGLQTISC